MQQSDEETGNGKRETGNPKREILSSGISRFPFPVSCFPSPVLILIVAAVLTTTLACEEVSHRDIGDEINILVRRDDALVNPAIDRLARYRRSAIPQIETAMHTAAPTGRHHLIATLEKIGDREAVPILRHVAVFDITPDVRGAAENLLSRWAAATDDKPRAVRAQAALAEIARKRAAGIGPMLFGANGIPGVPSTIGAPEPVGSDSKQ